MAPPSCGVQRSTFMGGGVAREHRQRVERGNGWPPQYPQMSLDGGSACGRVRGVLPRSRFSRIRSVTHGGQEVAGRLVERSTDDVGPGEFVESVRGRHGNGGHGCGTRGGYSSWRILDDDAAGGGNLETLRCLEEAFRVGLASGYIIAADEHGRGRKSRVLQHCRYVSAPARGDDRPFAISQLAQQREGTRQPSHAPNDGGAKEEIERQQRF